MLRDYKGEEEEKLEGHWFPDAACVADSIPHVDRYSSRVSCVRGNVFIEDFCN